MNNKYLKIVIVIALALAIGFVLYFKFRHQNGMDTSADISEEKGGETSTANLPQLIDLGSKTCIPCKMMAPILEELAREYKGKLDVLFIDVRENPAEAQAYGIRVIPTQIFYDANGQEFFRHEGFFSKDEILQTFKDTGLLRG